MEKQELIERFIDLSVKYFDLIGTETPELETIRNERSKLTEYLYTNFDFVNQAVDEHLEAEKM
ncbi:hypothetical protein BAMA_00475 [Bacillus manliponensis]|uniref:Uncharacterized protein n=1 Tax=Bacillus manliponensis TaxID=574376 RepID=A0A073K3V4_9BACI|nr:hypothetical protein [Bacillus manliponensis]KEK21281.1 hypothetical protein BAMA_00475 [Bacillus manliponensis]